MPVNWSVKIHCLVRVVIARMCKNRMKAVEMEEHSPFCAVLHI